VISKKLNLALFDLDHTLLPIDSDYAWGVFTTDIGWTDPHIFRQKNDDFFAHYQAGTLDLHDYVRFATQAVRLQGAVSAAAAHARFMREVVQPCLTAASEGAGATAPGSGRRRGDRHCDQRICHAPDCRCVWRAGAHRRGPRAGPGRLDHRRDPGHTFISRWKGHARFAEWLAARNLDWDSVDITFYSDSVNDLPLLERGRSPGCDQSRSTPAHPCHRARLAHTGPVFHPTLRPSRLPFSRSRTSSSDFA
jgi:hypothetical protein